MVDEVDEVDDVEEVAGGIFKFKRKPASDDVGRLQGRGAPMSGGDNDLNEAAAEGQVEAIGALLAGGASLEARRHGLTPLHEAILQGQVEAVLALLAAGASHDKRTFAGGATPLHLAATVCGDTRSHVQSSAPPLIEALVVAGASLEARAQNGAMPLHTAISQPFWV